MNTFGKKLTLTTFGESHGKALGCILDGVPAGLHIDEAFIQSELDRRKPGKSKLETGRKEDDKFEILSGTFEGLSTGTPIAMIIFNTNQKSKDYDNVKDLFRPGHADFTYFHKYGLRDYREWTLRSRWYQR
jgi:chorismate synthase